MSSNGNRSFNARSSDARRRDGSMREKAPTSIFNIPASAPTDRKTRRALVKALGARQFKKLYRKAQV